jgi:hypothetical protein
VFSENAQRVLSQDSTLSNTAFIEEVIEALGENSRQRPVVDCAVAERASRVLPALIGAEKPLPV